MKYLNVNSILEKGITILIWLLISLTASGQTISERLILNGTKDSLFIMSPDIIFDKQGNYCLEVTKNAQKYFMTNKGTIGGFESIGSTFGNGGEVVYTLSNPKEKPYYYKNAKGSQVYGPAVGKIEAYQTSNTNENISIVTTLKDSAYYYINGKLILQELKNSKKNYIFENDWISFSENGNTIYFLTRNNLYYLYVNDKLIDSSKFEYTQLAINNDGTYIYAEGKKPEKPIGKYNYMFFVHAMDTVQGPVPTVWNYELRENGAYYYSGDDNGPYYIAINGKLYKDIDPKSISNITLIDKNTYLFSFKEKEKNKINVNGKIYSHDFENIFYPTLDKQGNFAFYGIKDYYLYKFVNGNKEQNPVSKYQTRATPLYISPKGESLHYYKTEDSIYLYQNDKLIFKPISKKSTFLIRPFTDFLSYTRSKVKNNNSLFYLEYNGQGYLVFNGKLSKPMFPFKEKSYSKNQEQYALEAGNVDDNGFFAIQKTDSKKHLITINNEIYKEIDRIDYIVPDSCFFDGKELIFYGVKGLSFYQFKLNL